MNRRLVVFLCVAIVAFVGILAWLLMGKEEEENPSESPSVSNFAECVAAGYPVQESYPQVCRAPDGRSFSDPDQRAEPTLE